MLYIEVFKPSTYKNIWYITLGFWYLTPHSTIFQLYRGANYIGGGNRSTRRKSTTCLSQTLVIKIFGILPLS
jgi:hypothetical protein